MSITPLHDRILVRRLDQAEKTKGGIFIPDTAKEKPVEGEVIAVGGGKVLPNGVTVALNVAVGDRVMFSKYAGVELAVDGKDHLILSEDEVLGIVNS